MMMELLSLHVFFVLFDDKEEKPPFYITLSELSLLTSLIRFKDTSLSFPFTNESNFNTDGCL